VSEVAEYGISFIDLRTPGEAAPSDPLVWVGTREEAEDAAAQLAAEEGTDTIVYELPEPHYLGVSTCPWREQHG
jgi:hypothetical protein